MHSKSVTDLSEPEAFLTSEHPDLVLQKGPNRIARKSSFLVRARATLTRGSNTHLDLESGEIPGILPIERKRARVSRRTSFLESRPIRTLSKLTRRASFSTNEPQFSPSRVWSLNGSQAQRRRDEAFSRQLRESVAASAAITGSMTHLYQSGIPIGAYLPSGDEDFYPVDYLEGKMDLRVVLPSMTIVRMSIERRTPMMDLLIQATTSNKISPGDHVLQVMNERSDDFLFYKPSTPIGALEASTVHIMPKHRVNESIVRKVPMKMLNQPFETTFRLQVRLPRNQLYVSRVTPRMTIGEVLQQVCRDRSLDETKYEIRHPDNLDERLRPSYTLADYQLTEVTLVSASRSNPNSRSVSTSDIFRLQHDAEILAREAVVAQRNLGRRSSKPKSSAGESSVSSGSLGDQGDRSLSPLVNSRSELGLHQIGRSTTPNMPEPPSRGRKKRAPPPPGGGGKKLPPTPGNGNVALASLHRSGLNDTPTKSISMSNLAHPVMNGDFLSASNLSTVSAGSVVSLNSTASGRMKRRAPVPPKKLSPSPPVVPIPEETPSLVHREEEELPKAHPAPAPRTIGISVQDTVEEVIEIQPEVEDEIVNTPSTSPLKRQSRFEESLDSISSAASVENHHMDSNPEVSVNQSGTESVLLTEMVSIAPAQVSPPSTREKEMREIPASVKATIATDSPKLEKLSNFSEAKVSESHVEVAKPMPVASHEVEKRPTSSTVDTVVESQVAEEPIEPQLRAPKSTVDLSSGLEIQEQVLDFDTESSTYAVSEAVRTETNSLEGEEPEAEHKPDEVDLGRSAGEPPSSLVSETSHESLKRQAVSEALDESFASIDRKELSVNKLEQDIPETSAEDPPAHPPLEEWEDKLPEEPPSPPCAFQDSDSSRVVSESPIQPVHRQPSVESRRFESPSRLAEDASPLSFGEGHVNSTTGSEFGSLEYANPGQAPVHEAVNVVPIIRGPMQFSIDSYDSRDRTEVPYYKKLSRSESMNSRYKLDLDAEPAGVEPAQTVPSSLPPNMNVTPIMEEGETNSSCDEQEIVRETRVTASEIYNNLGEPAPVFKHVSVVAKVPESFMEEIEKTQPILRNESPKWEKTHSIVRNESPKPVVLGPKPTVGEKPSFRSAKVSLSGNVPWIMRKTSLQSNRVMPNDDLALNLRRKQSFGTPGLGNAKQVPLRHSTMTATSMVNLSSTGLEPSEDTLDSPLKVAISQESLTMPTSSIQSTLSAIKQEIRHKNSHSQAASANLEDRSGSPSVGLVVNTLEKLGRPIDEIQVDERSIINSPSLRNTTPSPSGTLSSLGSVSRPSPSPILNESTHSLEDSQSGHSSLQSGGSEGGTMSSRIHHYHGPPSIQLGTWDDRSRKLSDVPTRTFGSSKSGRLDRHSLASLSNSSSELSSLKSSNHSNEDVADFGPLNEQVRAYVQRVEQNNQNKPGKFDPKVMVAKPWKRPSLSQMHSEVVSPTSPLNEAIQAARKPSARLSHVVSPVQSPPQDDKPPQFYFGQQPKQVEIGHKVKPTAIEKVKNNEALTHPQNIVVNPGYQLKEYVNPMEKSGKPNYAFGETPPNQPTTGGIPKPVLPERKEAPGAQTPKQPPPVEPKPSQRAKESLVEPKVKPVVVNYSKFADFRVPRPQVEAKPKRLEKSQSEVRQAFESELKAGKSRLKSYENHDDSDVGSNSVSPGPSPSIIPPPPPPQFSHGTILSAPKMNGSIVPPAPKLPSFSPNVSAQGKRIIPSASKPGLSTRDELLMAIRGTGGHKGLRKTGKNL